MTLAHPRLTPAYLLLAVGVIFTPLLVTLLLVHGVFGASLLDFKPTLSDEILYWHQIDTFIHHGFNGGYYTWAEIPAPAQFSHFYTWGPGFIMVYGAIGKLVGWTYASGPLFNLVIITLGVMLFILWMRPDHRQLLALFGLLLVFWPLLMFIPITIQETLHHAAAFPVAILFFRLLKNNLSPQKRFLGGIFLFALSLVKSSWAFLFIPYFLLTAAPGWHGKLIALVKAGFPIRIAFVSLTVSGARYLYNLPTMIARTPAEGRFPLFWDYFTTNLLSFIALTPQETVQYLIVIALIALFGWHSLRKSDTLEKREALFHFANLAIPLVFIVLVYFVYWWRGYRILSPPLLITFLLFILFRHYRLLLVLLAAHLIALPGFLAMYSDYVIAEHTGFGGEDFGAAVEPVMLFDDDAPTAWCNTVLVTEYLPELMYIPTGIGISYIPTWELVTLPFKSQYLLLTDEVFAEQGARLNLTPLVETEIGAVYRNEDAECHNKQ